MFDAVLTKLLHVLVKQFFNSKITNKKKVDVKKEVKKANTIIFITKLVKNKKDVYLHPHFQ